MPSSTLQFLSGPAAYRADATRDRRPGAHDSHWIAVTSLLEHASAMPDGGAELFGRAIEIARGALGDLALRRRGDREWRDHRGPSDAVLLLADDAYEAGAFNMVTAMLGALDRAAPDVTPVQRGRLLARHARAVARLGRLDDARDQFQTVEQLGRRENIPELRARGWLGLGSIAQMNGNYPAVETFSRRALRLAKREGLSFIERYARLGLMVAAGAKHDFDAALLHGWAVYEASIGHAIEEGEILQSFGQLMVEAGYYAEARAAFGAVVARELPARILVPALGGLAVAASETGQAATVSWVTSQLQMPAMSAAPRYVLALALLECSVAEARVGRPAPAEQLRKQATEIALKHGFHEVTIRADEIERRESAANVPAFVFGGRATRIANQIASMEPGQLPDAVLVFAAPA